MKKFVFLLTAILLLSEPLPVLRKNHPFLFWRYQRARKRYRKVLKNYKEIRNDFLRKKPPLDQKKRFLLKATKASVSYLQMVEKRIEAVGRVSPKEKSAALAQIRSDIDRLVEKQKKIEKINTSKDLKEASREIKKQWLKIKTDVKLILGRILVARVNYFLQRLEGLKERIVQKSKEAERKYDTAKTEALLAEFEEGFKLAKEDLGKAKEKFLAISTSKKPGLLFKEGCQFLKKAIIHLRHCQKILKKISSTLKV